MFLHYIDLSWRSFKRTPLVSMLMVSAIAVGIGITMTSLSVYHMMSMDPIPSKSDRLFGVQLNITDDGHQWFTSDGLPYQVSYKDAMAIYNADLGVKKVPSMRTGFTVHMSNSDATSVVKPFLESARVTGRDFFAMFELNFLYGSAWSAEQETSAASVVIISRQLNQKLFGGTNSLGKEISLDNTQFQIVGVIDDWDIHTKYYDLTNGAFNDTENMFIPVSLMPVLELPAWGNTNGFKFEEINSYEDRLASELVWLQFWVELNTAAQQQMFSDYLAAYLTEQSQIGRFSREKPHYALRDVNSLLEYYGVVSQDNRILVGLSFMFLIVCLANILGLLLGKFIKRAPEVGVRRALGANKTHIFMQHLVEVSMLGLFGGIAGIGIAQLGLWGVRQSYDYYSTLATMDISMLLAAPAIAIVACILAGIYPAWLVCKTTPAIYLKTQ